jgi:hypothetical protein
MILAQYEQATTEQSRAAALAVQGHSASEDASNEFYGTFGYFDPDFLGTSFIDPVRVKMPERAVQLLNTIDRQAMLSILLDAVTKKYEKVFRGTKREIHTRVRESRRIQRAATAAVDRLLYSGYRQQDRDIRCNRLEASPYVYALGYKLKRGVHGNILSRLDISASLPGLLCWLHKRNDDPYRQLHPARVPHVADLIVMHDPRLTSKVT